MTNLKGKTALVTGGGQGIGKAVALKLLESGMRVAIAEADAEAGRETEAEFKARGDILFIETDVTREADVKRAIELTEARFGGLDALVNNAGINIVKPLAESVARRMAPRHRHQPDQRRCCSPSTRHRRSRRAKVPSSTSPRPAP